MVSFKELEDVAAPPVSESPLSDPLRPVQQPPRRSWYASTKRVVDLILASGLLILTLPVIGLSVMLVRLNSRGPALYSQVRLGYRGQRFVIYKIRTMFHDCERQTGPMWSPVGDARVTPIGRWLRSFHLDELPQLWNVIRGEMSLVGPRPERPEIVQQLERVIPNYRIRHEVRPGITGLAQVQLPPDQDLAGVRQKVACDLVYVAKCCPWLDARILLATVLKLVGVRFSVSRRLFCLLGL